MRTWLSGDREIRKPRQIGLSLSPRSPLWLNPLRGELKKQTQFWQRQLDVNTFEKEEYEKLTRFPRRKNKPNPKKTIIT